MLEKQDKKISNIEKMLTNQKQSVKPEEKTSKSKSTKYTGLPGALFDLIKDSFFDKATKNMSKSKQASGWALISSCLEAS